MGQRKERDARARVQAILEKLARDPDRSDVLARIGAAGGPRYGVDDRGRLLRVDPDGTRTTGTFADGVFVADA